MSFPSPARDYFEKSISLDKELIKHPQSTFFMHAEGDSTTPAYIPPRALLVIDRSLTPRNGDIVVAVMEGRFTVRYLRKNEHTCWLYPANKKYQEQKITPEMNMEVWGVVTQIIVNPKDVAHV